MLRRIAIWGVIVYGLLSVAVLLSLSVMPEREVRAPILPPDDSLPELTAQAWGVFDTTTGAALYVKNPTTTLPIASVTKLVTAAVVRESHDESTETVISWADVAADGRAGNLVPGDTLSYHMLLFPLLLESSNDAALALTNAINGAGLVREMNTYAAALNLQETTFADASGLSAQNVSSADNLGRLLTHIFSTQPHLFDISQLPQYYSGDFGWQNSSPFVRDVGYRGGKHGFTPEARRTAVVVFNETFIRNEVIPVSYVVLGSEDVVDDVRILRELVRTRGIVRPGNLLY